MLIVKGTKEELENREALAQWISSLSISQETVNSIRRDASTLTTPVEELLENL